MQVAPQVLREETVGGVSDQDVVEVVGLLILEIWPSPADQLAANELREVRIEVLSLLL